MNTTTHNKKLWTWTLAAALSLTSALPAAAAGTAPMAPGMPGMAAEQAAPNTAGAAPAQATVTTDAEIAAGLNLLQGEGNGLDAAYLAKETTRLQAALIHLRLKGLEPAALAYAGSETFADASAVPWDGGRRVLAYLKAHPELGWQGTGENQFQPNAAITGEQLSKVLLESLGYKQDADFEYANVLTQARQLGLAQAVPNHPLQNRDTATLLVGALNVKLKDGSKTLAAQLNLPADKLMALNTAKLQWGITAEGMAYLEDGNGMALYYFTKDRADLNACQGTCITNWPIFYADELKVPAQLDRADLGVLVRPDGTKQTTYKGWPLYYFIKDTAPGQTTGQNVGNVWYLVNTELEARIKTYSIDIKQFKFSTPELTIEAGSKVTFTNYDTAKHNAAAVDGSFRTELLAQGESATVTFDKPGEYEYVCDPHKNFMKAKIIVK